MTPVNESLGSGDSARSLRQALGDALYTAGDRLAESGGVLEVRVLQGGQIVTGIVGGDSASPGGGAVSTLGAAANVEGARRVGAAQRVGTSDDIQPSTVSGERVSVQTTAAATTGAQVGAKPNTRYRV